MFQGGRDADAKNRAALDFDVGALDAVLLTHAHIDHSGLLPRLCARGFRGPIFATPATCDLVSVMLQDSAHIQEKDAQWARERAERDRAPESGAAGSRRPRPPSRVAHGGGRDRAGDADRRGAPRAAEDAIDPLYTVAEAQACLRQFKPVGYDVVFAPAPGVEARFRDAGHILGSAIARDLVRRRDAPAQDRVLGRPRPAGPAARRRSGARAGRGHRRRRIDLRQPAAQDARVHLRGVRRRCCRRRCRAETSSSRRSPSDARRR